jgi:hypothetical protein
MMRTTRVRLDRIASSTRNAQLGREVFVSERIVAAEGFILAVRLLDDKSSYNTIEDLSGRMVPLRAGDVVAGTLGARRALHGYAGEVPARIAVGDVLNLLNLGGVIGQCTSASPELGAPFRAEVLGAVLSFPALGDRIGQPAHIRENSVPAVESLGPVPPVIYVAGTCMNTGKTYAAAELIRGLSRGGLRVAACKLTGVALMRDTLHMLDAGAITALTFNDSGLASTRPGVTPSIAKGVLTRLSESKPEVIVAELGDGILGEYGVQDILRDRELTAAGAAWIVAASDPVGCWGAVELLRRSYGLEVSVLTGPATDNEVGLGYIRSLGVQAHNARHSPQGLVEAARQAIARHRRGAAGAAP